MNEDYVNSIKSTNALTVGEILTDIFKNPNSKELREIGKSIRFIIDCEKKDIFVWKASAAIHFSVLKLLQRDGLLKTANYKTEKSDLLKDTFPDFLFGIHKENEVRDDSLNHLSNEIRTWKLKKIEKNQIINNFNKIANYDFSWLSKFGFSANEFTSFYQTIFSKIRVI